MFWQRLARNTCGAAFGPRFGAQACRKTVYYSYRALVTVEHLTSGRGMKRDHAGDDRMYTKCSGAENEKFVSSQRVCVLWLVHWQVLRPLFPLGIIQEVFTTSRYSVCTDRGRKVRDGRWGSRYIWESLLPVATSGVNSVGFGISRFHLPIS
ncbi:hypothetical protein BD779DRAFT_1570036 [Infundibulicybe gibba]|nr:hypothetical protein BD779DRAFT_1570036 [Infundibulicybe gibba]